VAPALEYLDDAVVAILERAEASPAIGDGNRHYLFRRSPFSVVYRIEPLRDLIVAVLHPNASKITGVICGVRIAEIDDPLMRKIRYMDKLVDELAKGRPMAKILRA